MNREEWEASVNNGINQAVSTCGNQILDWFRSYVSDANSDHLIYCQSPEEMYLCLCLLFGAGAERYATSEEEYEWTDSIIAGYGKCDTSGWSIFVQYRDSNKPERGVYPNAFTTLLSYVEKTYPKKLVIYFSDLMAGFVDDVDGSVEREDVMSFLGI